MALLLFARRIQFYQVACNVFEFTLCSLLHLIPSSRSEFVYLGRHTFLATIFGKFVQRVNAHKYNVIVLIDEFYHFLHATINLGAIQSGKLAHAMIDVHNIVAHLNGTQLLER